MLVVARGLGSRSWTYVRGSGLSEQLTPRVMKVKQNFEKLTKIIKRSEQA